MVLCGKTFSDNHASADLRTHAMGTAAAIVETVSIEMETVTVVKSIHAGEHHRGNLEIGGFEMNL